MQIPAILKDKRVLIGGGALVAVAAVFMLVRARGNAAQDDGSGDTYGGGMDYYSMPYVGGIQSDSSVTGSTAGISDILSYSTEQAKIASNQNLAAISSQFAENLATTLSSAASPIAGAAGNFNVAGTPFSFDFTFKDKSAVITSPPIAGHSSNAA